MTTLVIAHRGSAYDYPENTLPAFLSAVQAGANGIELDVHLSADDVPIVHHDDVLGRVFTGETAVRKLTLAEIKQVKPRAPARPEVRIPTLREVFAALEPHAHRLLINIELKSGETLYPDLERVTAAILREFGLEKRVVVSSFNHYSLLEFKAHAPMIAIGLLYMEALVDPHIYAKRIGAEALHPYYPSVTADMVNKAHAEGIRVHPFTVNDPRAMRSLAAYGVDAFITDDVAAGRAQVESSHASAPSP